VPQNTHRAPIYPYHDCNVRKGPLLATASGVTERAGQRIHRTPIAAVHFLAPAGRSRPAAVDADLSGPGGLPCSPNGRAMTLRARAARPSLRAQRYGELRESVLSIRCPPCRLSWRAITILITWSRNPRPSVWVRGRLSPSNRATQREPLLVRVIDPRDSDGAGRS